MLRLTHLVAVWCIAALPAIASPNEALLEAVRNDDRLGVARLISEGSDVNVREQDGGTALAWAAIRSNVATAERLLNAGAHPNLTNELGIGPLYLAIANGSEEIASLLLEKGADPNLAREDGETPLMLAARLGQAKVVKLLLARGASVTVRTKKFGQTPLMWAAGHPEIVRLLLKHGAEVGATTTTWDVKYTIYAPVTVTVGRTGIPWNTDGDYTSKEGGENALFFAVRQHDVESARLLLDAGIEVDQTSADGTTPLLAALYHFDRPSTVLIVRVGDRPAAGTSQRLHADLAMVRFLLDRGATVTGADGAGYTPLHAAALAVANAALGPEYRSGGGGANRRSAALLNLGNTRNRAPPETLEPALAIVKSLLDGGADANLQTVYPTAGPASDVRINPAPPESSAFHIAAASTNLVLVKLLADKGGNPNLLRKDGHTPFTVSVAAGSLEMVKEMITRGADLKMCYSPKEHIPDPVEAISLPRQDQTIMHLAALGGSLPIIEYLHTLGLPLDAKNSMGETPLDLADQQERYRETIERETADGDPEQLRAVVRNTETSDGIKKILAKR